jgi:hypothetical protein
MTRRITLLLMLVAAASGCSSPPVAQTPSNSASNATTSSTPAATQTSDPPITTEEPVDAGLGAFTPRGAGVVPVRTPDGYVGTANASWSAIKEVTQEQLAALPCWVPPSSSGQPIEGKFTYRAVHIKMSFTPGSSEGFAWPATEAMKAEFLVKPTPSLLDSQYVAESYDGHPCPGAGFPPNRDVQTVASTEEGDLIWYSQLTPNHPRGQWSEVKELGGLFILGRANWHYSCGKGWQGSEEPSLSGNLWCRASWAS